MPTPIILQAAGPLLSRYDVLLCDVWGVVHDGKFAYPGANDALPRFRDMGGTIVLVSNAPMTAAAIATLLDEKGVRRDAWDAIVSSGDLALQHIAERGFKAVYGVGPRPRDNSFFEAVPALVDDLDRADAIACTGLIHERTETAADYRPLIERALRRGLPFVCVNPDLAVHVGADLLPCAGAIAALYETMGGVVFWGGKPHPVAYATGLAVAAELRGEPVDLAQVLGIGDAVRTDLKAAAGAGVDALFIAGGLHRDELMRGADDVDATRLEALLAESGVMPVATMGRVAW